MKKSFGKMFIVLICIISLNVVFSSMSFAEFHVSYPSLFASVENSDGAISEAIGMELLQAFYDDANGFLESLSNQPDNIIKKATKLLSGAGIYNDSEKFESVLSIVESKINSEGITNFTYNYHFATGHVTIYE